MTSEQATAKEGKGVSGVTEDLSRRFRQLADRPRGYVSALPTEKSRTPSFHRSFLSVYVS